MESKKFCYDLAYLSTAGKVPVQFEGLGWQEDRFKRKSGFVQTMMIEIPVLTKTHFQHTLNIYTIGRIHGKQYSKLQLPENGVISWLKIKS